MTNIFNPASRSLMPGASSLPQGGLGGGRAGHITPTSVGFPSLSNSLGGPSQQSNAGQVSPNRGRDVFATARLPPQRPGTSDLSRLNLGSGSFGGLGAQTRSIGSSHPGGGPLGHHGHHSHHGGFSDPMGPTPPTLDQSEFPSLSYRALNAGGGGVGPVGGGFGGVSGSSSSVHHSDSSQSTSSLLSGRTNYGSFGISHFRMGMKQQNSEPAEFTMTSEDFPALPGVQGGSDALGGSTSGGTDLSKTGSTSNQDGPVSGYQGMSMSGLTSSSSSNNSSSLLTTMTNGPSLGKPGSSSSVFSGGDASGLMGMGSSGMGGQQSSSSLQGSSVSGGTSRGPGIQWYPDGRMTNIPAGMLRDQYGIAGLLAFIKTAEADPSQVTLTLGTELTNLGLNLSSTEPLYPSFGGASFECPIRPQDMDFPVPIEYRINSRVRDQLAPIKLNRYGEDLLFYIFYLNPQDLLQMAAAAELYNREWRYHKEEKAWITRAPGMVPVEKTSTYERGTYYFFDVTSWRKVVKEFLLEYEKLEDRPPFPHTVSASSVPPGPPVGHQLHQQPPGMMGVGVGVPPSLGHQRLPHPSQQGPPQPSQSQPPNLTA